METSQHLYFYYVVAKLMWKLISQVVGYDLGRSFETIGACWLSNKNIITVNIISSAALWSMEQLLMRVVGLTQNLQILCLVDNVEDLSTFISNL